MADERWRMEEHDVSGDDDMEWVLYKGDRYVASFLARDRAEEVMALVRDHAAVTQERDAFAFDLEQARAHMTRYREFVRAWDAMNGAFTQRTALEWVALSERLAAARAALGDTDG